MITNIPFLLTTIFLYHTILGAEAKEQTIEALAALSPEINRVAERFDIPPRLLASAIYADRRMNYNLLDEVLDVAAAKQGRDNSIGFAQIKVSTALWVCQTVNDPESPYYIGEETREMVPFILDRNSLLHSLTEIHTNLVFAVAYGAMVLHRWRAAGYDISENPAIFATLYNLGPYRSDGSERVPHDKPKSNYFGQIAEDFYFSLELRDRFPITMSNAP